MATTAGTMFSLNPRLTCGARFKDGEGVEWFCQKSLAHGGGCASSTNGREAPDVCAKCGLTWRTHIDGKAGACPFEPFGEEDGL